MACGPTRIHIVGGPGSGKTTLARHLGACLHLAVYDLDAVAYAAGAGRKRLLSERLAEVAGIVQAPGWISEGIYLGWCDELAERADLIIWLDTRWSVAAWRIVRRHVIASLAGTNRHPGMARLIRFVWATRRYYLAAATGAPPQADDDGALSCSWTMRWLQPFGAKVVRCGKPGDVDALVDQLCGPSAGMDEPPRHQYHRPW